MILPLDLDALTREDMKSLILALWEQNRGLTTRVAELEAQFDKPPKNLGNSSLPVTASLRDDPLGRLFARRHIDDAQYRGGLKLLELFELAEIGSLQAMDPGKEPVDGRGAFVEPITDRHAPVRTELKCPSRLPTPRPDRMLHQKF